MTGDILLESGTNELEVIVFSVGTGLFGINVIKVREIIQPLPVTQLPNSHPHIEGIIRLRDEVITLIDLSKVLSLPPSENPEDDKFIIAELNKIKAAFRVKNVSQIHRLSWEQIEKPSDFAEGLESSATGVVKLDDEMVLLLDFEKVIVDINPEAGINIDTVKTLEKRDRQQKKLIAVEDSSMLRMLLEETLTEAGYDQVTFFENGQDAWAYFESLSDQERDEIKLIITDIEMPQMDGHHLTKKIKENEKLKSIPVVIFSSLITDDLYHKGQSVGADAQISKPEIVNLIETIDHFVL